MKTIKKVLLILLVNFQLGVFGQLTIGPTEDYEVLEKYWYYRWRLRNDFMYTGSQPGESLPFAIKNIYGEGNFGTGDVSQLLGYYISTLATEYKLLEETNRWMDYPMTFTELYYAFKAFERLDIGAEPFYPHVVLRNSEINPFNNQLAIKKEIIQNHYHPSLNGLFLRADYPRDFFGDDFSDPCSEGNQNTAGNVHFEHLNGSLTNNSGIPTTGTKYTGDFLIKAYIYDPFAYECIGLHPDNWTSDIKTDKDYSGYDSTVKGKYIDMDEFYDNMPSTDQINTLLQSFLLTKVSLPNASVPVTLTNGTIIYVNFVQLAKDNSERLINFLKNSPGANSNNGWKITMPNGEFVDAEHGGFPGQYSFPIAQIGNMIHDNNLMLPFWGIPIGFHNAESILKQAVWQTYQAFPALAYNFNAWNSHSDILHFAAMSNSWRGLAPPIGANSLTNHNKNVVLERSENYAWD